MLPLCLRIHHSGFFMRLLFLLPAFMALWKKEKRRQVQAGRSQGVVFINGGCCWGASGVKPCSREAFEQQEADPRAAEKRRHPREVQQPRGGATCTRSCPPPAAPPCRAGPVSTLTYHALHFGNNTAGRSGRHLLREVTRVENVVHGRPMLTVVQQLVMFRILKRGKRRNKDTRSERLLPIGRTETRTPLSLQLLMVKLEHLN